MTTKKEIKEYDYIILEKVAKEYSERSEHDLMGLLENCEDLIAKYQSRIDKCKVELRRRASLQEVKHFEDNDYTCDIFEDIVYVQYKIGRDPDSRAKEVGVDLNHLDEGLVYHA